VQSFRAQPDEEARENVIDALRELLAARFGSPPELQDRTDSDSLELRLRLEVDDGRIADSR
jgi:hypothetical protein